jgi:hypothetical protein
MITDDNRITRMAASAPAVGFDINTEAYQVDYVSQRLRPNAKAMRREGPAAEKLMMKILTTKFDHWAYEKEYRLFVRLREKDNRGLYFWGFEDALVLKSVIVGTRSTVTRAQVSWSLGKLASSVKVFKAQLAQRSFEVVRNPWSL